jgi:hypothetical protein
MTKQRILVTVHDGVAKAVQSTVPKGITIEVIDYDAIEQYGRRSFSRLSKAAQRFALADSPNCLARKESL